MITGSIVTYKNDFEILAKAIYSFLNTSSNVKLYIIDNSPTDIIRNLCYDKRIIYHFNNKNVGFGKAHNQVLRQVINSSKYHIVINPDVYFQTGVIEELVSYIEGSPNTGLIMPKILNPDGSLQYNCKLLPKPSNLIIRRFLNVNKNLLKKSNFKYEMKFADYNSEMLVPFLSGCFMFLSVKAIQRVGFFDERFFLYGEDIDYSRRIHEHFNTVYYPKVSVFHYHEKGSYKSLRLLYHNTLSAIKYFNKWGWIDKKRDRINEQITNQVQFLTKKVL